MDDRAQTIAIARMFLSLVAAAMVYWIMDEVTEPLFEHVSDASNSAQADAATGWFEWIIANSPLGFALIAFFGLVVISVYQSERL